MTNSRKIILLATLTIVLLWVMGRMPAWNRHAQVDIWVMWERVNYFISHGYSFKGLSGNEILPSTLLYLFIPMALVPVGSLAYANFLPIMMMINALTIAGHWFVMKDKTIFLTSLIFFGPLLLFRFDALVTLIMVLAFYTFAHEKYELSGVLLGLATGMKVFPVIFLPYLIMVLIKRKEYIKIRHLLIYFGEALIVPVLIFFVLGGSYVQVTNALAFHTQKLISIESLPGSIITGWSLLTKGMPPQMLAGNGIWAVAGPSALLNRVWMIPVALVYLSIWMKSYLLNKFNYLIPFVIMLIFSVFSKNLNPQYMWWFLALLPMIKPSKTMWILALLGALLNQIVFPLFYTTFTVDFFQQNQAYWIYYCLLLRNILIFIMTVLGTIRLFGNTNREIKQ